MTAEQKEAISIIDKMIKSYIEADECGLSNNDFKHEIKAMQTALNLIQEQEKEIYDQKHKKTYARQNIIYKNKQLGLLRKNIKILKKEKERYKYLYQKALDDAIVTAYGFVVLAFQFGEAKGREMMYVSNANRDDIVKAMEEWIDKTKNSFGNDTGKY